MKFCALILALCLWESASYGVELNEACQSAVTHSHDCCQKPDACEFPRHTEIKTHIANLETEFGATAHISGAMSNLEVQSQKVRELRRAISAAKAERQDEIAKTCLDLAKSCLHTCAKHKAACGQDLATAKSLGDEAQKMKNEAP